MGVQALIYMQVREGVQAGNRLIPHTALSRGTQKQGVSKRRGHGNQHSTASTWSLVQGIPEEDNPKNYQGL